MSMTIRNPVEWGIHQFRSTGVAMGSLNRGLHPTEEQLQVSSLIVRPITTADLWDVLKRGVSDFGANRTDVIFLCLIYPVVGLVLARVAAGSHLLPLLFPLASGFALVGPVAGLGLYEMSRRRELGIAGGWRDAFGVLASPSLGAIVLLSLMLTAIYIIWELAAFAIYELTLGPQPPASIAGFAHDVLTTQAGWAMIVVGVGLGFLFAVVALAVSVVAFPLLLDREVGLETAVGTSVRAVVANPVPMAAWGLIVVAGLVLGSIPLFVGLAVALPVLGHATWHLYRKLVIPQRSVAGKEQTVSGAAAAAGTTEEWR
jgi:uncharacterized membrane protein